MNNYAVINGKRIELTDEQAKMLGIKSENPFKRVAIGDTYYRVTEYGEIDDFVEEGDYTDQYLFNNSNYFNDDSVAQQVALHQLLYRKLLKFSYDNNREDTAEWNGTNYHWAIRYNENHNKFESYCQNRHKARDVYFSSEKGASRAIEEVIEPFMKEHPDFVW